MKIFSGTSGYSYKEWKGSFYPSDIAASDMLAHYAKSLNTVEINNTFYRMPRSHVVEGWRDAVGADFRFSIKATRRITHIKRLNDDIAEPLDYLIKRAALLEDKLGAVLFQLPGNFKLNHERLAAFLKRWPKELPAAFEFRHESWFEEQTYELLAAHNVAMVASEDGESPIPQRLDTAPMAYLRLRKPTYTNVQLRRWLTRCQQSGSDRVYAFFKHEDAGAGPKLATRFTELSAPPAPKRAARRNTAKSKASR